jgi:hypothetical protein
MAQLRELPVSVHHDDTGRVDEVTDNDGLHDVMVDYTSYNDNHCVAVTCTCKAKWTMFHKRDADLNLAIVRTFQAHLSFATRLALKPD